VEAVVMAVKDVVVVADAEDVAVVAGVVGVAAHQPTHSIIETLTKRTRMIDRMRIRMGMEMATAPPSRV
jgi:hypothetical protein